MAVDVRYQSLASGVVASTGPRILYDFNKEVWFPCELLEATGIVLSPCEGISNNSPAISIKFGSKLNFYYGLNKNPPPFYIDFVPVAIHEMFHGLGIYYDVRQNGTFRTAISNRGADQNHL